MGWVLEIAPNPHQVLSHVSKLITVIIKKSQMPNFDIESWLSQNQIPSYYIWSWFSSCFFFLLEKIKYLPKTDGFVPVLSWNLAVLQRLGIDSYWRLWFFFKFPDSLILNIFKYLKLVVLWFWIFSKYLKLAGITKIKYSPPHWCKTELNHTTDSIGNLIIIVGIGSHFVWRKLPKVPSNFTFQKSSKTI